MQFAEDVLAMGGHGVDTEETLGRNLLGGVSQGQRTENLTLGGCERIFFLLCNIPVLHQRKYARAHILEPRCRTMQAVDKFVHAVILEHHAERLAPIQHAAEELGTELVAEEDEARPGETLAQDEQFLLREVEQGVVEHHHRVPVALGILLEQLLQIHADIRPDIFIPGTTKYTNEELAQMIKDDTRPIYVAADENDNCLGYAFCQLREQPFSNNMVPFTSLFIDDLCVDASTSGQHIGEKLFVHVKEEAKRLGCYEVTLNVWAGNTSAEKLYEKMGLKTKEQQMEYIL